jgi:hypothetical protein
MKAAVVERMDGLPHYRDFTDLRGTRLVIVPDKKTTKEEKS